MKKVFIIAEAGVNHNGDLSKAKQLVDVAKEAKVDAIKFQSFKTEQLVCKHAPKADYQIEQTGSLESQFDMIKRLELTVEMHKELIAYCKQKEIMFLSAPFDIESIDLLHDLGLDTFKVPSGELTNLPYIRKIAQMNKKMIISTGMATLEEIEACLNVVRSYSSKAPILLHCNTEYPTPMEDVHLRAMLTLKERFKCEVGYSDHTLGIEVPIAAVALGATVIEKHITLDKTMEGPDHKASLEPDELKQMVSAIRHIEKALGSLDKKPSPSEMKNKKIARKSIVALKAISKGEKYTEENLTVKRPGTGISPMRWDEVIGKVADRNYVEDELIQI